MKDAECGWSQPCLKRKYQEKTAVFCVACVLCVCAYSVCLLCSVYIDMCVLFIILCTCCVKVCVKVLLLLLFVAMRHGDTCAETGRVHHTWLPWVPSGPCASWTQAMAMVRTTPGEGSRGAAGAWRDGGWGCDRWRGGVPREVGFRLAAAPTKSFLWLETGWPRPATDATTGPESHPM